MSPLATLWLVGFATLATAAPAIAEDAPGDVARGKTAYERNCAGCHGPGMHEGRLVPGTASLEVKYRGKELATLEDRTDLSAAYVMLVMRRGSEVMPFFRPTEVSNQDLRDIAEYLSRKASNGQWLAIATF